MVYFNYNIAKYAKQSLEKLFQCFDIVYVQPYIDNVSFRFNSAHLDFSLM